MHIKTTLMWQSGKVAMWQNVKYQKTVRTVGFHPTVFRHTIAQTCLALAVWLNKTVRSYVRSRFFSRKSLYHLSFVIYHLGVVCWERTRHSLVVRTSFSGSENVIQCFLTKRFRFLNRFLRATAPQIWKLTNNIVSLQQKY